MKAPDTPPAITSLLEWRGTWLAARIAIATVYLVSAAGHRIGRWEWLATEMLGVLTALGAILAHPFWTMEGSARFDAIAKFTEHAAMVGGLVLVALVAERDARGESADVR
jgi:transmembrane protein